MTRARCRRAAFGTIACTLLALALFASSASATFHEVLIREVYPGSATSPGAEYVELQMWSAGQNLVGGHLVRTFGPGGNPLKSNPFDSDLPAGANQSTMLLATPEAEAQFHVVADGTLEPSDQLDPGGGAVCWESIDCVSWGSFGGALPSPAGSPAAPIPDGMALRRTISPGCATLLEPTDDRDNSAVDLSAVFPAPRPNSAAPGERPCASTTGGSGQGGPGAGSRNAPRTSLRGTPAKRTRDRTPSFRFGSNEAGSTFQCKLDGKPFRACHSPFTSRRLNFGKHVFKVRARDDSGQLDPSPAAYAFRVVAKP